MHIKKGLIMQRRHFIGCGLASLYGVTVFGQTFSGTDNKPRCGVASLPNPIKLFSSKWGKTHLTYYMSSRDTNDMEAEVWDKEFRLAFDAWSEIIPLTFEKIDNKNKADVLIGVSKRRRSGFGRSGGVLAWAQMPSSRNYDGQLWTMFDLAENWVLPDDDGIILRTVACHEIGHLLGLDHSNDKSALMYPYINDALKPRDDDVKKIQKLYGKK